jgi:hypothetical protein
MLRIKTSSLTTTSNRNYFIKPYAPASDQFHQAERKAFVETVSSLPVKQLAILKNKASEMKVSARTSRE